jgi:hypothetical protein
VGNGYYEYKKGLYREDALRELRPDIFSAKADGLGTQSSTHFGTNFPKISKKGDLFVRVDVSPNRVFKFDGNKWIEVNKEVTQTYLYDQEYIKFLIDKIGKGEYDLDSLNDAERNEIENYLKGNQNS